MKVYEIISEAGEARAIGWGSRLLGKLFGSAERAYQISKPEFIEKTSDYIANLVKSRGNISVKDAMARYLKLSPEQERAVAKRMSRYGETREKALDMLGYHDMDHPYLKDASILKKIENEAVAKLGTNSATLRGLGQAASKTVGAVKGGYGLWKKALAGLDGLVQIAITVGAGLYPPYARFRKNMENAAGHVGVDWTQEQFEQYADEEVGILLAQWTAVIAAGAFAKLITLKPLWSRLAKSDIVGLSEIGRAGSIGFSAPIQYALVKGVNSYSEDLAALLMSPLISWLPDTVGGIVRAAVKRFAFGIGLGAEPGDGTGTSAQNTQPTQGTASGTGDKDNTTTTSKPDNKPGGQSTPADPNAIDHSKDNEINWVPVPGNSDWVRDPKNISHQHKIN